MAELDEEMRLKMSGLSGDGGEAGIEYEDGQPVAMKRSVKNNSKYTMIHSLLVFKICVLQWTCMSPLGS